MKGRWRKYSRSGARQRSRDWRRYLEGDPESFQKHRSPKDRSLVPGEGAEPPNVEPEATAGTEPADETAPRVEGMVLGVTSRFCRVRTDDGEELDCRLRSRLAVEQQSAVAVGDRVHAEMQPDGVAWVQEVLPRRTVLARPDPHNPRRRRVIAANVETVVIVAAVRRPGLRPGLLDRFLLAVETSGARPLLCVNKVDLIEDRDSDDELALLEPYRQLGLEPLLCAAATGEGIAELARRLAGQFCVFVGHSGVGKSSLLNALDPDLDLATQTVRVSDGTGRHTTTHARLFELPGDTLVIDTPGIRQLGLWNWSPEEVREAFEDLAAYAPACRFANCTHTHEPDCAVKQAVADGEIPEARYQAYLRILDSLDGP